MTSSASPEAPPGLYHIHPQQVDDLFRLRVEGTSKGLEKRVYRKGEPIINEGDSGSAAYVVANNGGFDIWNNKRYLTTIEGEGSFTGEAAILFDTRRTATVTASRNGTIVIVLPTPDVAGLSLSGLPESYHITHDRLTNTGVFTVRRAVRRIAEAYEIASVKDIQMRRKLVNSKLGLLGIPTLDRWNGFDDKSLTLDIDKMIPPPKTVRPTRFTI